MSNNSPWCRTSVFLLSALILLLSASAAASEPGRSEGAQEVWASDGYGLLVEIGAEELHAFEVTSISCIPGWTAKRLQHSTAKQDAVFVGRETYTLVEGSSPGTKRLHMEGTVSDIVLHRISELPTMCLSAPSNTPQTNYAVFWQTFAEQYAFFHLHRTDWEAVDRKFRPQISSSTRPEELFEVLRQMVDPFQDAHIRIIAGDLKQDYEGRRPDVGQLSDADWERAQELIDKRYIRGNLQSYCNGRLQFGWLNNSVAYLRITAFYGYESEDNYASELHALQVALDEILLNSAKFRGLIIDIRLNHGGDDPLGIEIASRLSGRKYLAYRKVARNNRAGSTHFTVPQESWVVPSHRPSFRGKVVLLIGPDTVSAGETFTMALLGRRPHVNRVGLNTQGVFSDVLKRTLPNGWRFNLPNEIYCTRDGKAFDVTGVPPDVQVSFFSAQDLENGRDAALESPEQVIFPAIDTRQAQKP